MKATSEELAIFVSVVESGSFSRAAEQLGQANSAVSRAVKKLEMKLGVSLLNRTTRQLSLTEEGELYVVEEQVIQDMALQGPCVIVGRCAGWILREREDVLRVFIHADREFRKKRAMQEYGIEERKVENILKRFDRRRSNFYSANTCMRWDDNRGYDLVLDSSSLGIMACVDLICKTARGK